MLKPQPMDAAEAARALGVGEVKRG
jgi:hypothetical protein